ncbi:MASE1 domain-containing protein [Thermosynechococcaceae cyanobacterium BACA0444]|uniref:Circadian input-output histidine kinase CikA n=1 Tax=Pseudocalidococcus azoricus BACA0444 TaxID=2918990 RepID=A0AAE4FU53_9CYAN|nr:MASE1 domain-containing protein [Pseudocalidococcus azoricus]MDS3861444.1 MASE1 domain-containing protein [Pseudocalidococcus azoricus BACA0444]
MSAPHIVDRTQPWLKSLGLELDRPRWWLEIAVISLLYTGACWLVLKRLPILDAINGSPFWPGAGITVGGLLTWGRSRWFGVTLGALLVNWGVKADPLGSALIGTVGITLGVLLTVTILRQLLGTNEPWRTVRNVVIFTVCALFTGTLIQSITGVGLVLGSGMIAVENVLQFFANWWIGDSIGVLVIAPVFYTWLSKKSQAWPALNLSTRMGNLKELGMILICEGLILYLAFGLGQPLEYLLFPPLIWCSFRFPARVTTLLVALTATVAAVSTTYKLGTFYRLFEESQSLLLLQLFIGVMAVTVLVVLGVVAENHQAEWRLSQLNEELEQRVLDRTDALQTSEANAKNLAAKAEAANQAKSAFIANMSHELRSPLNAVLGFSQLMLRSKELSPSQYENVGIIYRSGDYLLTLINNILDLSKLEANKATFNPQNFDLIRLLNDLEDMLHLRATNAGLDLVFSRSPDLVRYVQTDEMKLRQVLINLLSNGIKFTPAGRVWLQATSQPTPSPETWQLTITVGDTGVGISPEELSQLFEPFTQGQAGREKQEGTGLGLSISRKFVQLMGGDIQVKSQIGLGTQFHLQIPVKLGQGTIRDSAEGKKQVKALAPGQAQYRILVVDDQEVNRKLLIKLLEPLGFAMKEAVNGQEAVAIWDVWEPHLIWMDMRMPVMDGYEATKQIKATTKGHATAVIALTASVLEEEQAIILSAGCDDFLRKPFAEHTIFDALTKHLGVTYIYEDSTPPLSPSSDQTLTTEKLSGLASEWLSQVYTAALEADNQSILSLIEELPPHYLHLQTPLSLIARQFQFETLIDLIEPLLPSPS